VPPTLRRALHGEAEEPNHSAYCAAREPDALGSARGTILETLRLDRNFLLDTEGNGFLTFHHSREVGRNLHRVILGSEARQEQRVPCKACAVFCDGVVHAFDEPFPRRHQISFSRFHASGLLSLRSVPLKRISISAGGHRTALRSCKRFACSQCSREAWELSPK
jgi:hypothetical protein